MKSTTMLAHGISQELHLQNQTLRKQLRRRTDPAEVAAIKAKVVNIMKRMLTLATQVSSSDTFFAQNARAVQQSCLDKGDRDKLLAVQPLPLTVRRALIPLQARVNQILIRAGIQSLSPKEINILIRERRRGLVDNLNQIFTYEKINR